MISFRNKVAVITGAGSGIGRHMAMGLWKGGATVCLAGRNRWKLERAIPNIGDGSERVRVHTVDITRDDEVRDLATDLQTGHQRIDALVHSAGQFAHGPWESVQSEELDLLYKTNLRAPVLLTQALLPALKAAKGQIVFINSSAGINSRAFVGAYSAMKHGLRSFADSLREELNPTGIRVLSVFPGRTATPMQELVCKMEGREYSSAYLLQPDEVAESILLAMKESRTAEVTDLHIRPVRKPT